MSTRVTCSGYIIMNGFVPLYDLKDVELEVVRLRNVPEYGVVGRLLAGFDLPQLHSGVRRGGRRSGAAADRSPPAGARPPHTLERSGDGLPQVLHLSGRITARNHSL